MTDTSREIRRTSPEAERSASVAPVPTDSVSRRRPSRAAAIVTLCGLALTAALSLTALGLYHHNENRLLTLRARELSSVLGAAVISIQTPLASAAELADATDGSTQKFREFMAPYVGPGRQFASASLWPLEAPALAPRVVLGTPAVLA